MYILDIGHISVLIGCDLLKKMQATIDYRNSLMITYGNESSFNNLSNIGVYNKSQIMMTITGILEMRKTRRTH